MKVTDAPAVHKIDCVVSVDPWSERLYVDCVDVGYNCWVLMNKTDVIGFGILSFAANEAHILNIAISPDEQRKGLGEQMFQHLLNIARQQGSAEVFLEVRSSNEPAITLYKKYGFAEIGIRKGYYPAADGSDEREDALTFALSLW